WELPLLRDLLEVFDREGEHPLLPHEGGWVERREDFPRGPVFSSERGLGEESSHLADVVSSSGCVESACAEGNDEVRVRLGKFSLQDWTAVVHFDTGRLAGPDLSEIVRESRTTLDRVRHVGGPSIERHMLEEGGEDSTGPSSEGTFRVFDFVLTGCFPAQDRGGLSRTVSPGWSGSVVERAATTPGGLAAPLFEFEREPAVRIGHYRSLTSSRNSFRVAWFRRNAPRTVVVTTSPRVWTPLCRMHPCRPTT